MKAITTRSTVSATADQVSSSVEGGVVILQMKNGVYYSLDPVGAFVWEHMKTPITVEALCALVVSEYEVDGERAQQDLLALLQDLAKARLIRVS